MRLERQVTYDGGIGNVFFSHHRAKYVEEFLHQRAGWDSSRSKPPREQLTIEKEGRRLVIARHVEDVMLS